MELACDPGVGRLGGLEAPRQLLRCRCFHRTWSRSVKLTMSRFRILTMPCTLRSSVLSILLAQRGQMAGEVQMVVRACCLVSLLIELTLNGTVGEKCRK